MNNLRRLDLNLLVTLDVLLSEHNVTRAAERLNFSQPSVSVHLAKLRDVLGDAGWDIESLEPATVRGEPDGVQVEMAFWYVRAQRR